MDYNEAELILGEIMSEFETLSGGSQNSSISKERVERWMRNDSIEVLGAAYTLLIDPASYMRIEPRFTLEEKLPFVMRYLERCIKENPQGEWSHTQYEAGWEILDWFMDYWRDPAVSRNVIADIKSWLEEMYKFGNDETRECIVNATIEHLFEIEDIRAFFEDWAKDPLLVGAYEQARDWAEWVTTRAGMHMEIAEMAAERMKERNFKAPKTAPREIGTEIVVIEWDSSYTEDTPQLGISSEADFEKLYYSQRDDRDFIDRIVEYVINQDNWTQDELFEEVWTVVIPFNVTE